MTQPAPTKLDRRGFFKAIGPASAAALSFLAALETAPQQVAAALPTTAQPTFAPLPETPGTEPDVLIRMQGDVQRALAKKPADRRWVMVIDLRKCVGCHACTIACVAENKLPPGVVYRPVLEQERGTYPNVSRMFIPRPCMQCDNPPCVPVCPVTATYKNEDGITVVDYDQCIGCRACIVACPYGARTSDFGYTYGEGTPSLEGVLMGQQAATDYERAANYEYGRAWEREGHASPIGNARKCHFCLHRVKEGMLPECVTTCIGRATLFGDANDPESVVAEMIKLPNVMRLKEELGTEPRVYYLL